MFADRPLVARFDQNGDERLDADERKAARQWMATQPPAGIAGMLRQFGITPEMMAKMFGSNVAPSSPGRRLTPADVASGGNAPLYDQKTLRTIFLQFDNADWEEELADFYNSDVEVPATVVVDGRMYRDVGVHFRGMSSFMMVPEGSKRSLNLSFDYVHEDQRILGHRTMNLLNVNGDPTFVRPLLYTEIARQYVPTPEMNYVRVVINGESWGVYISAEQFNSDFIDEHFDTRRGARWRVPGSPFGQGGMSYLGESADLYKGIYSIRTEDDPRAWDDLIRMFRVLNETPADRLEAALSPLLDIDGALRFLALDVALVNSDGYWVRASDYSIYQDVNGQFHVIPHDVNEGLKEESAPFGPGVTPPPGFPFPGPPGAPGAPPGAAPGPGPLGAPPPGLPGFPADFQLPAMMGQANAELDPLVGLDDASKALRSRLLAVPALRERYLGYVREIADRWLDWQRLEPLVRQYHALIGEEVRSDTRKLHSYEAFHDEVDQGDDSLKGFVDRRRAFLLKTIP
jgi:spore coat protein CotH